MRYTTVIDLTEYHAIWRNPKVTRLYVYMAMKAGYHDDDKDMLHQSIRSLAMHTGLSIGATRHALHILMAARLLSKNGDVWQVVKWVQEATVSPRPKQTRQSAQQAAIRSERAAQAERDERERQEKQKRLQQRQNGKTPFMVYYEAQLEKARQGDLEAAKIVQKNKVFYEEHCAAIEQEKNENLK